MERFPECSKQKTSKQKWDATIAHLVELEIHITKSCRKFKKCPKKKKVKSSHFKERKLESLWHFFLFHYCLKFIFSMEKCVT